MSDERDPIDLRGPGRPDQAVLMLIERIGQTQVEQGRAVAKAQEDSHKIQLALASIAGDLKPLVALASTVADLRVDVGRHTDDLRRQAARIGDVEVDVAELEKVSSERAGWEGFGGKALYLVGGAMATLVITALIAYARNPA